MNSPALDVKDMINEETSLGLVFKTNLFVSVMPTSPDVCVATYDTGGGTPLADKVNPFRKPTVQVRVRGGVNDYQVIYNLANKVYELLHATANEGKIRNTSRLIQLKATSDILYIGRDEHQRPIFSMNFSLYKTHL